MNVFFVVLARDSSFLSKKIGELDRLGRPYIIVCGEKVNHPRVVHRSPRGKYDAVNFGLQFVPPGTDVVVFNDVDTEIHNFEAALNVIKDQRISMVFARVKVFEGPQLMFYTFLDPLRRRVPIAASGELMLVRMDALMSITPLRACKAEDSFMLFKILEEGRRAVFCEECYVTTQRTSEDKEEEAYKRRTVGGIYQALAMTRPPVAVRFFYTFLPLVSPLLLILRKKGLYWMKGILSGFVDYARGDRSATWKPIVKS
jgi:cellulose synthase/poly-beta-1,6-N-acetylglucosamine synthase-like glycosyltransferase